MWKLDDKYHISSDTVKGAQYIHKVSHANTLISLSEFQVNSFLFHVCIGYVSDSHANPGCSGQEPNTGQIDR